MWRWLKIALSFRWLRKLWRNPRDLSEYWQGILQITIEGVGTRSYSFGRDVLANHVAVVQIALGGGRVFVNNNKMSPWRIISFDRAKNGMIPKLVVARVTV